MPFIFFFNFHPIALSTGFCGASTSSGGRKSFISAFAWFDTPVTYACHTVRGAALSKFIFDENDTFTLSPSLFAAKNQNAMR